MAYPFLAIFPYSPYFIGRVISGNSSLPTLLSKTAFLWVVNHFLLWIGYSRCSISLSRLYNFSQHINRRMSEQEKSKSAPKQLFICTCRKEYESFPALYLHNKTKHNITIHTKDKLKMKKKSVWSGNKKRVVYEFSSDAEEEERTERKSTEVTRTRCSERFKNKRKNQENESDEIEDVLSQFVQFQAARSPESEFDSFPHSLFLLLAKFLKSKDLEEVMPCQSREGLNSKIEGLPFYLNPFILEHFCSENGLSISQAHLKVIEELSGWLYEQKICKNLAVLNMTLRGQ